MERIQNLFLCIGAQKAGTSWLYSVLSKDERFSHCPFVKEIHYFDHIHCDSPHLNNWRAHHFIKITERRGLELQNIISGWLNGEKEDLEKKEKYKINGKNLLAKRVNWLLSEVNDDWYHSITKNRNPENYAMDITPDYAVIGSDGFNHIKKIANNIKIVFILRDPIERAWSGLLQGKKKRGGVSEFIETIDRNIEKIIKECTTGADVGARSNYLNTIKALEECDLLDKTLILKYEDISRDPKKFIEEIYDFLDTPPPEKEKEFWKNVENKVYVTNGKKSIPEELKLELSKFYAPMIKSLSHYTDIPPEWDSNK
ncbi:sulfotransferase domain-containing protein [Halomonas huangheensis]|uniref:Sulfotransferase domain-containing protein n=1 Tax=Halomonas huangheensis TaxID=1178482 RepID=W1NBT8_9GAMM|nr:sulfotransferase domain-containing protein [Halomonas huangheensis]ALM53717.1 hypothetical protein AR456_16625 [Halomonas huangheensis]ERL52370.1 hypothetical protein BJB45_10410 [Halomonas huangheensis]